MPERKPEEKIFVELGRNLSYLTTEDIVLPNRGTKINRDLHPQGIKTIWTIPAGTRINFEEIVTNKLYPGYYYLIFRSEGKKFGLTPRQAKESIDWDSKEENKRIKSVPYIFEI